MQHCQYPSFGQYSSYRVQSQYQYQYPIMSGFLSSEAERALMGEEDEARRLFNQQGGATTSAAPLIDPQWALAHTSAQGQAYYHPNSSQAIFSSYDAGEGSSAGAQASGSTSASKATDLHNYGYLNDDQRTWRCAYPSCNSKAVFTRACDLRKHFNRHSKNFFCRHDGCPQSTEGGFSSNKDRARHEAKHNPGVPCEWAGCERIFSRVDNMKDHVKRIHMKGT